MARREIKKNTYFFLHNSGVEKRTIFSSKEDFDRFEAYLYLLNAVESPRAANFFSGGREAGIFESARGENLVSIGAYSFVPQRFMLLVTPRVEGGVGKFMQKLQTAYTMYFNKKYAHQGRLFQSAYRSLQLDNDVALRYAHTYTHLAPATIFNSSWEDSSGTELAALVTRALQYRYSSAGEYQASKFVITSPDFFPAYIKRMRDAQSHFSAWMKLRNENIGNIW